jgi:hypothetical protein
MVPSGTDMPSALRLRHGINSTCMGVVVRDVVPSATRNQPLDLAAAGVMVGRGLTGHTRFVHSALDGAGAELVRAMDECRSGCGGLNLTDICP